MSGGGVEVGVCVWGEEWRWECVSVGGGVEMGVCECGKAWHILDTGGRCACTSAKVGVCVCVCV